MFKGLALLLIAVSASLVATKAHGDHPAVKVMALLQKLQQQVKEEGETEAAAYAKFTYWCAELTKEKSKSIAESKETISVQESTIEALTEDIAALNAEIASLAEEITKDETAKTTAQSERDTANGDYVNAKSDYEGTISAIGEAIASLEGANGASLVSVNKAKALVKQLMPKEKAFLEIRRASADPIESANADEFESRAGREVVSTSKTGGVIELLKNLKLKFEDELIAANKAETNSANSHSLADAAKEDEVNAATRAKDSKTSLVGRKGQDLATAESDLSEAESALQSADTVLKDTQSTCRTRADEWEERSKTRAGEVAAMGQAIEVLEKITGVRTPESKGISFIQMSKKISDPRAAIVNLLRKAGSSKRTAGLAKLADQIAALSAAGQTPGSGTFDQIKNMIEKMIFHLMSEQKDEDDHKNWCDKELDTTTMMQTDKETKRDELAADIASLNAEIEALTNGISENNNAVSEMEAQTAEETELRQADKTENSATIQDAKDAQSAVQNAISVLEDFYKSTGEVAKEAWEFVQVRSSQEPETFSGAYTGTSGGAGVIGMLTDISSDFASMEAQARSDETTQQDEYDTLMTTLAGDMAEKKKDTEMKSARKERMGEKLAGKSADESHNTKELEATVQYMADLQHACVDGDSTYADRKGARTQEIDALRQAQGILENAFAETETAE